MVKCCFCGMNIVVMGIAKMGWFDCPECKEEQWAIPHLNKTYPPHQVTIDHENETVSIDTDDS